MSDRNLNIVWGLQNQRLATGSVISSVPNHQFDKAGYKSYSHSSGRKGKTTVSVSEKSAAVAKRCKCSHPEFSHEPEGDKICKIISCWDFEAV